MAAVDNKILFSGSVKTGTGIAVQILRDISLSQGDKNISVDNVCGLANDTGGSDSHVLT